MTQLLLLLQKDQPAPRDIVMKKQIGIVLDNHLDKGRVKNPVESVVFYHLGEGKGLTPNQTKNFEDKNQVRNHIGPF